MWTIANNLVVNRRAVTVSELFVDVRSAEQISVIFPGDQLILQKSIPAVAPDGEEREIVQIPKGERVEVVRPSTPGGRLVEVVWKNRRVLLFPEDLEAYGERLGYRAAD